MVDHAIKRQPFFTALLQPLSRVAQATGGAPHTNLDLMVAIARTHGGDFVVAGHDRRFDRPLLHALETARQQGIKGDFHFIEPVTAVRQAMGHAVPRAVDRLLMHYECASAFETPPAYSFLEGVVMDYERQVAPGPDDMAHIIAAKQAVKLPGIDQLMAPEGTVSSRDRQAIIAQTCDAAQDMAQSPLSILGAVSADQFIRQRDTQRFFAVMEPDLVTALAAGDYSLLGKAPGGDVARSTVRSPHDPAVGATRAATILQLPSSRLPIRHQTTPTPARVPGAASRPRLTLVR
ncbi:MAG: hypothetical protein AAF213_09010 [Pseudomonadota bacterium]